jgi:hypothetical protein
MMTESVGNKVLISHSSKDAAIADALSEVISRCSPRQIAPWHSSDRTAHGGIAAGQRWFEKVRTELKASRSVIVLLTPNSVTSSWVQFEAGFGAGSGNLEIIPVVYGLADPNEVPDPLTHWQIYRIGQLEDCIHFLEKLFGSMDVHFDRDMIADPVAQFIRSIEKATNFAQEDTKITKADDAFSSLRNYLDKKFIDLASRMPSLETNFAGYDFVFSNSIRAC